MLTVFMDYRGVVYDEFLPEGQTVNVNVGRYETFAWSDSPKKTGFVGKQLVDFAPR